MTRRCDRVIMDYRTFYDRVAASYDRRHASPVTLRLRTGERKLIRRFAGGRVLDIGCGTGYHMDYDDLDIIGIEISDEMIKIAKGRGHDVKRGLAERLPFSDGSFDTIFCFFAVLNMCDHRKAVQEMARVLKPGGCALLSLSSINDKKRFKVANNRIVLKKLFTKDELVELFGRHGFVLEHFDSVFRSGRPKWGDYSRLSLKERYGQWSERFRDTEKGVVYIAAFRKIS